MCYEGPIDPTLPLFYLRQLGKRLFKYGDPEPGPFAFSPSSSPLSARRFVRRMKIAFASRKGVYIPAFTKDNVDELLGVNYLEERDAAALVRRIIEVHNLEDPKLCEDTAAAAPLVRRNATVTNYTEGHDDPVHDRFVATTLNWYLDVQTVEHCLAWVTYYADDVARALGAPFFDQVSARVHEIVSTAANDKLDWRSGVSPTTTLPYDAWTPKGCTPLEVQEGAAKVVQDYVRRKIQVGIAKARLEALPAASAHFGGDVASMESIASAVEPTTWTAPPRYTYPLQPMAMEPAWHPHESRETVGPSDGTVTVSKFDEPTDRPDTPPYDPSPSPAEPSPWFSPVEVRYGEDAFICFRNPDPKSELVVERYAKLEAGKRVGCGVAGALGTTEPGPASIEYAEIRAFVARAVEVVEPDASLSALVVAALDAHFGYEDSTGQPAKRQRTTSE